MAEHSIALPKLGESIVNATVVQWFKKVGDRVHLDEPLLEVSTDKVNSEIPSPVAGIVKEILVLPDVECEVGDVLAIIESTEAVEVTPHVVESARTVCQESCKETSFLSPAVLRFAAEKGISLTSIAEIKGTGASGRVTKCDIEAFAQKQNSACSTQQEERLKMTGMRKAIAENMVKSFYEAPHATLVHEIDVTDLLHALRSQKELFAKEHGVKLTITGYIVAALSKTLLAYPLLNASVELDTIVMKKQINIGVAVHVEQGLVVPVVKHCHSRSFVQIVQEIDALTHRARDGKLQLSDVAEGTFTLTNFGMSGVLLGIPIIRHPEVGILGVGAIKKRVHVGEKDTMAIRSIVHISLTFDHRVIDGMYGCAFLAALQKQLEVPELYMNM